MEYKGLKRYQHYKLCCNKTIEAITSYTNTYNTVLEIGPGTGVLTKKLNTCVDVAEINKSFHVALKPYVRTIYTNFFKIPIRDLDQYDCVIGNLPYRHSCDIFLHLEKTSVPSTLFLIQREVGAKLLTPTLSRIKLLILNTWCITESKIVSKTVFRPVPKVDGILLYATRISPVYDSVRLKQVISIFTYPRKTLGKIYCILNVPLNLYVTKRPSELTQLQFEHIYNAWFIQL